MIRCLAHVSAKDLSSGRLGAGDHAQLVQAADELSRAPESRGKDAIPKLSNLHDSGAIEQDADIVFLLRRPSYYKEDKDSDDLTLAIVDVAKHRNGPTGKVRLNFFADYTRFDNRIETAGPDE